LKDSKLQSQTKINELLQEQEKRDDVLAEMQKNLKEIEAHREMYE